MLAEHAPDLRVARVLADPDASVDELDELRDGASTASGARLVVDDVGAAATAPPRHDPLKLAAAYARIMR